MAVNVQVVDKNTIAQTQIVAGQTTTGVLDINGCAVMAVLLPDGWDGGDLGITVSDTPDGAFVDLCDSVDGSVITLTAPVGVACALGLSGAHMQAASACRYIKLKATTAPVADRVIKVIAKG